MNGKSGDMSVEYAIKVLRCAKVTTPSMHGNPKYYGYQNKRFYDIARNMAINALKENEYLKAKIKTLEAEKKQSQNNIDTANSNDICCEAKKATKNVVEKAFFRAIRKDNHETVFGYYSYNPFMKRAEIFAYDDVQSYVYVVFPESVERYIGIHDKKGKMIFERDILQSDNGHLGQVVFEKGGFYKMSSEDGIKVFDKIFEDNETVVGHVEECF